MAQNPILKYSLSPRISAFSALVVIFFFGSCARFQSGNTNDFGKQTAIYLKTDASIEDIYKELKERHVLVDFDSFQEMAESSNLGENIHPGKYKIEQGMNNYEIVKLLKSGKQEVVKVVINKLRKKEHIARHLAKKVSTDSASFMKLFADSSFLNKYGINTNEVQCIVMPYTYDVYWNSTPVEIFDKMHKAYKRFWNESRKEKAAKLKLSQAEVITIASIVDEETIKKDEMANVASVYLNRIRKGMKLQADPTARFAYGDFSIKRVLNKHIRFKSPWNTYLVEGIPPGPICTPSPDAIDAVLENKQTEYIFFCAKEDFSGYHNFAKNGTEHEKNADKFRKAMDARGIRR